MSGFWDGQPELTRRLEEVRSAIREKARSDDSEVQASVSQLLESNGKMLRPAFVILASQFGAPDADRINRIAAAIEMLHMATLAHDDIIDSASLRRGVATLYAVRGPRTAVLVGDWLFAVCFSLVADVATVEDSRAMSRIVARICGSEVSQSAERHCASTSVRRYLRRIAGKTAALFALSFHVGAYESGCSPDVCSRLRRFGYCLGMGFQIIDDVLDIDGLESMTGKPAGQDLADGVYTLPTVFALRNDDGRLAAALSRRPRSRRALASTAALIRERDGIRQALEMAQLYTERSLREISGLPPGDARTVLENVADSLLHRTR
ncbi:MAG TPA: polyprenyl synthetase family protein [Spirochaetia bacterium]|nr:polyprenyl synthetase family protein [Spirochaetia bacterium]